MTAAGPLSEDDGDARDGELFDAIVGGDLTALDALYRRHASLADGLALRLTGDVTLAQDVVQSAFLSIWSDRPGPDGGTEPVRVRLAQRVARASMDHVRRRPLPSRAGIQAGAALIMKQPLPVLPQGS
ncbi:MAG: hypothetical protein NVS9B8_00150 [Candidatus Limnocylindrales bacterium]